MLTICCSVKGGSGTSVVAALLALHPKRDTVLVDLDGDGPAVLGLAPPAGQGLSDWFESDAPAAAVSTLAVDVDRTTRLVARGTAVLDPTSSRWRGSPRGWRRRTRSTSSSTPASATPPASAPTTPRRAALLVIRPCFLALARAVAAGWRADGVVLLHEPWRSLGPDDVERALDVPVVARLEHDPAIARAVDAGLAVARLPCAAQRLHVAA